jgi:hypothetical protein
VLAGLTGQYHSDCGWKIRVQVPTPYLGRTILSGANGSGERDRQLPRQKRLRPTIKANISAGHRVVKAVATLTGKLSSKQGERLVESSLKRLASAVQVPRPPYRSRLLKIEMRKSGAPRLGGVSWEPQAGVRENVRRDAMIRGCFDSRRVRLCLPRIICNCTFVILQRAHRSAPPLDWPCEPCRPGQAHCNSGRHHHGAICRLFLFCSA